MPWTLASLTQAIIDWAENPETTFEANVPNMIRMAELRIAETVQTPSVRQRSLGVMTPGVSTIAVPPDFLAQYSLFGVDRAGVQFPLLNKEDEFCRTAYPDVSYYERPEYYSIGGGNLITLAPTPDWAYPYVFTYFARPVSIVDAPGGTTYIGTNAEDVLFFACMKNGAVFMKEEADVIAMYDGLYMEAVYNFRVTGHGRNRKDWFRKPDRRKEVTGDSTVPPLQAPAAGG